ncbi:PAS domain S-box protein [Deinococcus yunweiensis]|uniref:PAS domain S-box protein n=1 Tax=Deinococcus yunweiensis TaxID=367282 RepID=UPI00398E51E0
MTRGGHPPVNAELMYHGLEATPVGTVVVDVRHADPPLVYVNPAFERLTGYAAAEVLGHTCRFLQGAALRQAIDTGRPVTVVVPSYRKDGSHFLNELSLSPVHDDAGTVTHLLGVLQDVTVREEALQRAARAEQRLNATLDRLPDPFVTYDRDWKITYVNAAANFGHPTTDIIGPPLSVLSPDAHRLPVIQAAQRTLETGMSQHVSMPADTLHRELDATTFATDDGVAVLMRDVTAERQVQRDLQDSQERFLKVFEASPLAITITRLQDGQFVDTNPAFTRLSGYAREDVIGRTSEELRLWADAGERAAAITVMQTRGQLLEQPITFQLKSGEIRPGILSMVPVTLTGDACVVSLIRDVSDEQRAQQAAREAAAELQRTLDQSPDMIVSIDVHGRFVRVSAACERLLGYRPAEMAGQPFVAFLHPEDRERSVQAAAHPETLQGGATFENRYIHQDGGVVWMEWSSVQVFGGILYAVARDITARRAATADQAFLAAIVQASTDAIMGLSLDGTIRAWNTGAERMFGTPASEMIGRHLMDIVPSELVDEERAILVRVAHGERPPPIETVRMTRSGIRLPVQVNVAPITDGQGAVVGISGIVQDISHRRAAEQQIRQLNTSLQRKLDYLTGLRAIDQAIASNLDLPLTLGIVLDQVKAHTDADAVTALLLEPHDLTLSCIGSRGFTTPWPHDLAVRLGDTIAGRVVLSRQPVTVDELRDVTWSPEWQTRLMREELTTYAAVPVLAKGRVLGVIEVLRRRPFDPASDWLEILQTLAGQAAIAVDNAQLFLDLERGNFDLNLAYQETIEGWARALDLRDHETEGHSRRVTEQTVELCRALGVSSEHLVHVRRGALLHDIGKMGIADAILLKPGPLTDDEWVQMRRHPGYAVELLTPIQFLRPALDIPHHHHEKWDGSGYPAGLKGSAIPLTARAFAVVDVYDALTNDRPYRAAWPRERALAHLQAQAGTHFDPAVVQVFVARRRKGEPDV